MITIKEISFPVLVIGSDNNIDLILDPIGLSITNKLGLKHGILLNNTIVDYRGIFFKPVKVNKIRNINPFWKFEFFNPMYEIQMDLEMVNPIEIKDLKRIISKALKSNFDLWNFRSKSDVDSDLLGLDEMKKVIDFLVSKR